MKPSIWEPSHKSISDGLRARLTIYRPGELAAAMGLSRRTILKAIQSGQLRAHRINSRVFEIESYEAGRWWAKLAE